MRKPTLFETPFAAVSRGSSAWPDPRRGRLAQGLEAETTRPGAHAARTMLQRVLFTYTNAFSNPLATYTVNLATVFVAGLVVGLISTRLATSDRDEPARPR